MSEALPTLWNTCEPLHLLDPLLSDTPHSISVHCCSASCCAPIVLSSPTLCSSIAEALSVSYGMMPVRSADSRGNLRLGLQAQGSLLLAGLSMQQRSTSRTSWWVSWRRLGARLGHAKMHTRLWTRRCMSWTSPQMRT